MGNLILPYHAMTKLPLPPDHVRIETGEDFIRQDDDMRIRAEGRHWVNESIPKNSDLEHGMAVWVEHKKIGVGPSPRYKAVDQPIAILMSYTPERTTNKAILHLSINLGKRGMNWDMFKAIRYGFFPDEVDVIQVFPKKSQYVNYHATVWHLWEYPGEWDPQNV